MIEVAPFGAEGAEGVEAMKRRGRPENRMEDEFGRQIEYIGSLRQHSGTIPHPVTFGADDSRTTTTSSCRCDSFHTSSTPLLVHSPLLPRQFNPSLGVLP